MMKLFYDRLKQHQNSLEHVWLPISSLFANAMIVLTVVLGFATYYQAQGLGQVEASLGYVDTFNSGEVLEARNLIYRSWLPYDFSSANTGVSRDVIDALLDRIVPSVSSTEGVEHRIAVAVIVAFFDTAQACISLGACNESVLQAQAGEYGRDFFCLYRPIIKREQARGQLVSFGSGLELMTSSVGGC